MQTELPVFVTCNRCGKHLDIIFWGGHADGKNYVKLETGPCPCIESDLTKLRAVAECGEMEQQLTDCREYVQRQSWRVPFGGASCLKPHHRARLAGWDEWNELYRCVLRVKAQALQAAGYGKDGDS